MTFVVTKIKTKTLKKEADQKLLNNWCVPPSFHVIYDHKLECNKAWVWRIKNWQDSSLRNQIFFLFLAAAASVGRLPNKSHFSRCEFNFLLLCLSQKFEKRKSRKQQQSRSSFFPLSFDKEKKPNNHKVEKEKTTENTPSKKPVSVWLVYSFFSSYRSRQILISSAVCSRCSGRTWNAFYPT